MKKSLKERITALGLSYQKEMLIILMIALISIGGALALILLLKQLIIGVIIIAAGIVGLYFYISR